MKLPVNTAGVVCVSCLAWLIAVATLPLFPVEYTHLTARAAWPAHPTNSYRPPDSPRMRNGMTLEIHFWYDLPVL